MNALAGIFCRIPLLAVYPSLLFVSACLFWAGCQNVERSSMQKIEHEALSGLAQHCNLPVNQVQWILDTVRAMEKMPFSQQRAILVLNNANQKFVGFGIYGQLPTSFCSCNGDSLVIDKLELTTSNRKVIYIPPAHRFLRGRN